MVKKEVTAALKGVRHKRTLVVATGFDKSSDEYEAFHQKGVGGVGPSQEYATDGGGGTGRLGEVLLRGDTFGVVFWGGDLGVIGASGAEDIGSSCGVLETGEKVEGKKDERRFMAEGGDRKSASGSGDTTAPDLLGQDTGNSVEMGVHMAYL